MEDPDVVDRGEGGEGPHPKCYPKPHLSSQLYLITPHENPKQTTSGPELEVL